nr:MAG TPA: hypothetical protein [Caudoviricetes sp.]
MFSNFRTIAPFQWFSVFELWFSLVFLKLFNLVNPWYYCICKDLRVGLWKSLLSLLVWLICLGLIAS